MANVSVSGAVSGIDTASLINSLVQAQSTQQTLLKTRQKTQQTASDTLARISAAVSAAGGLAATLADTSTWAGATATSSSASVTATATGTKNSSLSFDVTGVAAAHALVSHESVAAGTVVASGGTVTITALDGSTSDVPVGGGTLDEVVTAITGAGKGLVAAAVQTSPGQFRLQVRAAATGSASEFSLSGLDGFTAVDVLTKAADAKIQIGSDPDTAYEITSTTNTFANVVPGLSFTVAKLETGVTVGSTVDGSAAADQVSKFVDAVNGVLSQITTATAWNASSSTAGPLMGDPTVRSVQQGLLDLVSGAGAPGVRLTRDGKVTFDKSAFLTAFTADPDKVKTAFGAAVSFSPASGVAAGGVKLSSSTSTTAPGTYAVQLTQRATREQWSLPAASLTAGAVVQLGNGTTSLTYTVKGTDGVADVAAALTAQAAAAGLAVTGTVDGSGALELTATATGAGGAFTADVDGSGAGVQVAAGTDAAGTIDGVDATGVGDLLTLPTGTSDAVGLALDVSGVSAADLAASGGDLGTVTFSTGLAGGIAAFTKRLTASQDGALTTAAAGQKSQIKALQDGIDDWDTRLASYRAMLTQQFTAMETAIASLKTQTNAIASLVNSTSNSSSSSS